MGDEFQEFRDQEALVGYFRILAFMKKLFLHIYLIEFLEKMLTKRIIHSIICSVVNNAQVAELADAQDLKSCGTFLPCRFDPGLGHQIAAGFMACRNFYNYYGIAFIIKAWYSICNRVCLLKL